MQSVIQVAVAMDTDGQLDSDFQKCKDSNTVTKGVALLTSRKTVPQEFITERSRVQWLLDKPSHGSHRALSRLFLRCFALTSQKTRGRWGAPYLSQGSYMGEATECGAGAQE